MDHSEHAWLDRLNPEQLRAATAKSIAPWKLPLIGDMPVAKQLSVLGTVFGTALVLALLMIMLDNRAASQGAAARDRAQPASVLCPIRGLSLRSRTPHLAPGVHVDFRHHA